jgi:hypothetical protein
MLHSKGKSEVAQDPILRLFQLPFNVFLFYDYDEDNNLYA